MRQRLSDVVMVQELVPKSTTAYPGSLASWLASWAKGLGHCPRRKYPSCSRPLGHILRRSEEDTDVLSLLFVQFDAESTFILLTTAC